MQGKTKAMIRKTHKWLSLLVGIQLLLWIVGGLYMSVMPLETVRGRDLARPESLPEPPDRLFHVEQLLEKHSLPLSQLELLRLRPTVFGWVYEWQSVDALQLFDAVSGARLSPLNESQIVTVASADYAGDGEISRITLLSELPWEVASYARPLWQVVYDDARGTHLYIDPDSGQIVARRNTQWRIFDLLWRAHIMDYSDGENFNNPLLMLFAASALAFTISGLLLITFTFRKRDFGLPR